MVMKTWRFMLCVTIFKQELVTQVSLMRWVKVLKNFYDTEATS